MEKEGATASLGQYKELLEFVERVSCNADSVQKEVLSDILARNANTEYLQSLNVADEESFKLRAPLVSYPDIKPYIQRIALGDKSPILTDIAITQFFTSSGTSGGVPKLFPIHDEYLQRMDKAMDITSAIMTRALQDQGLDNEGKQLYFMYVKPAHETPSGLLAQTGSTNMFKSPKFLSNKSLTSPTAVILCKDPTQSIYSHLLCGLVRRMEVTSIVSVFATHLLHVIHLLQERWQELVEDIRSGTVNEGMVLDLAARQAMEALIAAAGGPNAELAQQVETECCTGHSWKGIIRRLWPHAKYVSAIFTGSMSQYLPMVEFYSGGISLVSSAYGASECFFGVNLTPLCPPSDISYMLFPHMAYFELLPVSHEDDAAVLQPTVSNDQAAKGSAEASRLLNLVDVKLGEDYEIVLTTYTGLYRYKMGDIVRVTGFHNKAPLVHFVCRKNEVLSIHVDKTDEETLRSAIKAATSTHLEAVGWRLWDCTSYADVSTAPGHYVLFWELYCCGTSDGARIEHHSDAVTKAEAVSEMERILNGAAANDASTNAMLNDACTPTSTSATCSTLVSKRMDVPQYTVPDAVVMETCCLTIEENLGRTYKLQRVWEKMIGPLEIRVVRAGTFNAVMKYSVNNLALRLTSTRHQGVSTHSS